MALADFFDRAAVAASHILLGYDDAAFRARVESTNVGLAFGPEITQNDGQHAADMVIRLYARLYPTITLHVAPGAEASASTLEALATLINPKIELRRGGPTTNTIVLGEGAPAVPDASALVYVGSNDWDALVSADAPLGFSSSGSPFGAGAAAAIACAHVFAAAFGATSPLGPGILTFSTLEGVPRATSTQLRAEDVDFARTVLVGLGAIGNAVVWALARSRVRGDIALVDDQTGDLGNLQRYVLAERDDVDERKTDIAMRALNGSLRGRPFPRDYATFVALEGYRWDQLIVALDSAAGRRSVQASLPKRIVNAWTQLENLGVSEHGTFGGPGACLSCLYLPHGVVPSDHELVADALRIPEQVVPVKDLLYNGAAVPDDMLTLIIERFGLAGVDVDRFRGQPIGVLYTNGICGGALVPLEAVDQASRRHMHVPVAHQSALAGILLAAAAIRQAAFGESERTLETRIDLRKRITPYTTNIVPADTTGRCICQDPVYVGAYETKYGKPGSATRCFTTVHANGHN